MDPALLLIYVSGWCMVVLVASRYAGVHAGIVIGSVKIALPALYFLYGYELWFGLDDGWAYYRDGMAIIRKFGPLQVVLLREGREYLHELAGYGPHVLYSWWNSVLLTITGRPEGIVVANIVLAMLVGVAAYHSAVLLGVGGSYAGALFIFQVLNPELLAWSSATNCKDVVVTLLTASCFWMIIGFQTTWKWQYAVGLCALCAVFVGFRFYVPALILMAWVGSLMVNFRGLQLVVTVTGAAVAAAVFLWVVEVRWLVDGLEEIDLAYLLTGFPRFLLTPRPWAVEELYFFLYLPSLWHWMMFVPAGIGAVYVWRTLPGARVMLVFALLCVLLFGSLEEYLGPRHRLQISFIYVWCQFHFFWLVLTQVRDGRFDVTGNKEPA